MKLVFRKKLASGKCPTGTRRYRVHNTIRCVETQNGRRFRKRTGMAGKKGKKR